jgi:hypothetical protein
MTNMYICGPCQTKSHTCPHDLKKHFTTQKTAKIKKKIMDENEEEEVVSYMVQVISDSKLCASHTGPQKVER